MKMTSNIKYWDEHAIEKIQYKIQNHKEILVPGQWRTIGIHSACAQQPEKGA